jgi:flagellar basal body-associated protein FliL
MKGISKRVILLLLGILFVSLFMSFKINERFGPREGFNTESMDMSSPPAESNSEHSESEQVPLSEPVSIESSEPATKHVAINPVPANTVNANTVNANTVNANTVNAMSQRLGLTAEDKTNMQSIITKVFANAGTFAAEKIGHMMEGFESKSSIASTPYI